MKSSILALLSAVLLLAVPAKSQTFFQTIEGKWQGILEYRDYSTNERVKVKTFVVVKTSSDGNSAEIFTTYDDFGKVLQNGEIQRIDIAGKRFYEDEEEFTIESIKPGRIVLKGSGQDGNSIEPFRKTITYSPDSLTILKETRTPFVFRNRLTLTKVSAKTIPERILTTAELKADFEVLKAALKELHPGLYRYNTAQEMEKKFDLFETKLTKPLNEGEFFKFTAQLLSEIDCYHTYLNPYNQKKEVRERLFDRQNYFPFYFQIIDGKMIVTENASTKTLARGSEITRINGIPTAKIIKDLLTVTSSDGKNNLSNRLKAIEINRSSGPEYALFDLYFPLFFSTEDNVFTVEAIKSKTKEKTKFQVLAMTKDERTREMETRYGKTPGYDDGWKFEIRDKNTGYLKLSNFAVWKLSFDYKNFLANSFRAMRAANTKNLIIDIRENGGGDDGVYRELFRYLSKKDLPCKFPVRSYIKTPKADPEILKYAETYEKEILQMLTAGVPETLYKPAGNGLFEYLGDRAECEPLKPKENNFRGKTYLLVNSANASAAFTFARYAQEYELAALVGQETGGNKKGFTGGSYLFVYLPNSRFEFDLPLIAGFSIAPQKDEGVFPDVYVKRKAEDIGNDFDRELNTAETLIGQQ
ncbi:MAG: hypothetical protein KDB79_05535 [Acidobacteria bacterium]|nr:hypothetical protein [Acidobacteriota bacterium]